jgi:hypothetical protein
MVAGARRPCGDDPHWKRVPNSCKAKHIHGGGHCEVVDWAVPDDETDCGCIVHAGANTSEYNQICMVSVLRYFAQ